ncbi:UNVERIFIED_CONTAM: hypothetical protein BEN50_03265 [Euhalothece sp. KZN 001]
MNLIIYKTLEGQWLSNQYYLKEMLGYGGFGAVFQADDVVGDQLLREVAVKVIAPLDDAKRQQQQLEELRAAITYNHPHLLRCFSAGEFNFMNGQFLYLVMELAEHSLEKYLKDQTLSLRQIKTLLEQVALGLDYLHREQQQVHRDLKPGNVLWARQRWVISDFGLVRKLAAGSYVHSNPIGTVGYMPPEAFDGKISFGWDIWSLGIMAVAAINKGELPYEFSGETRLIKQVMDGELQLPKLPPELKEIVEGCLQRERQKRWSAEQVLAALQKKEEKAQPSSSGRSQPQQPERGKATATQPNKQPHQPTMSRRRMLQLAGWGGVGLGGVIVGQLLFSSEDEPSPPPTQPEEGEEEKPPTSSQPEPRETEPSSSNLAEFSFEVVTVNDRGEINQRTEETAQQLVEEIGNGVNLEMVEIPSGSFLMGSPETEEERDDDEGPQHRVEVPSFLMGKYQVTQAQYQAIMGENPSRNRGANNPVETVNWNKAKEFCERLSEKTGREYRLPSEAEWEYACRAGTTTSFHFGETITTDLANYDGDYTYGNGPEGVDRGETTPVGSFPPNAFGLYDMHGNVWEWCEDVWHENYEGAPNDGSAWLTRGDHNRRVLRGGSRSDVPWYCRCANRHWDYPGLGYSHDGFRVVSSSVRTL